MLDDVTWLALVIFDEAKGEIDDGKAAVGRVVLNRTKKHYSSDGTIQGTILSPNQFSGFYFDMVGGVYTRVCHTLEEAAVRATHKLAEAQTHTATWVSCKNIAAVLLHGHYQGGAEFNHLTDDTVLYYNPAAVSHTPDWATPSHFVVKIGHHQFYRH